MSWAPRRGWGPEDNIQAAVVHALRRDLPAAAVVLAIPNGGALTKAQRGKMFGGLGALAGVHDLLILWPGGLGFIECKAPGKYPRPEQRAFGAKLDALGIPWACVRSVDEALAAVGRWGALGRIEAEAL